jgi:hypothetical protein
MHVRGADLLSLSVALPLIAASLPAAANENDDVLKVVDDFCANPRDKLKDVGVKASKLGFGAEYYGQKTIGGKAYAVELVYGFEENKPSGAFTLTTTR